MPACLSPLLKAFVERLLYVGIILTRRAAESATCAAGDEQWCEGSAETGGGCPDRTCRREGVRSV
jgi:hypothetical protein